VSDNDKVTSRALEKSGKERMQKISLGTTAENLVGTVHAWSGVVVYYRHNHVTWD